MTFTMAVRSTLGLAMLIMLSRAAAADSMLANFSYPFEVLYFNFTSQKLPLTMAYMDVPPSAAPNGEYCRSFARKEFLFCHLGEDHPRVKRRWLSRHRAGSDRLLQVEQAGALPIQLPATRREYARAAEIARDQARHRHRPFHRRHAGDPLGADVSRGRERSSRWSIRSGSRTGRRKACRGRASTQWRARELKTTAETLRAYERATYYAGSGRRITSAGSTCSPAFARAPARTSSRGTRRSSTT